MFCKNDAGVVWLNDEFACKGCRFLSFILTVFSTFKELLFYILLVVLNLNINLKCICLNIISILLLFIFERIFDICSQFVSGFFVNASVR